jgi:hypothetical protein
VSPHPTAAHEEEQEEEEALSVRKGFGDFLGVLAAYTEAQKV